MGSKAKTKEPERCAGTFPGQVNMLQVSQQALQYHRTPYLGSRESSICAVTSPESSKPTVPRICRVVQLCNAFGYTRVGRQSIKDMTQEELEQTGYRIFPSFLNHMGKRKTIASVVAREIPTMNCCKYLAQSVRLLGFRD
jgi:hypothetical protein